MLCIAEFMGLSLGLQYIYFDRGYSWVYSVPFSTLRKKVTTTDYTQTTSFHTDQLIIIRLTSQLSRPIFKQSTLRQVHSLT